MDCRQPVERTQNHVSLLFISKVQHSVWHVEFEFLTVPLSKAQGTKITKNDLVLITHIIPLQKEMFASKVDTSTSGNNGVANNASAGPPPIGGSYSSAPPPNADPSTRERKLSSGSGGNNSTTGMKSKWMKAFKGVKKQEPADER